MRIQQSKRSCKIIALLLPRTFVPAFAFIGDFGRAFRRHRLDYTGLTLALGNCCRLREICTIIQGHESDTEWSVVLVACRYDDIKTEPNNIHVIGGVLHS